MSETVEADVPAQPDGDDLDAVLHRAFDEADELTNNPAGLARDERGRFAAQDAPVVEKEQATPDQPVDEGPSPPPSWSDTDKIKWSDLTPEVREVIAQRDRDREQLAREREELEKSVNPLKEALRPFESKLTMRGISEAEAVKSLLNAQDMLERNFLGTLPDLIRQFGYDPVAVAQAMLGSPQVQQMPQQQGNPFAAEFQRMQAEIEAMKQERQAQQMQASVSQIEAFAADPAHPHFNTVRMEMGRMIEADPKLSLKDAYERAVWLDPTIRSSLIQSEAKKAAEEADRKARAEAEKRVRAGSSVRDSASSGGSASRQDKGGDVLDDLMEAWQKVEG